MDYTIVSLSTKTGYQAASIKTQSNRRIRHDQNKNFLPGTAEVGSLVTIIFVNAPAP